jgi:hypothetical protein
VQQRTLETRLNLRLVLAWTGVIVFAWLAGCAEASSRSSANPKQPARAKIVRDASTPARSTADAGLEASATLDAAADAGADASVADAGASDTSPTHAAISGGPATDPGVPGCSGQPVGELPSDLACTGLYADVRTKKLASGLRSFAPAHQLWSDGATKQRWILLPDGTQIDSSKPDEWHLPVGTKLFKEFSWKGHRVETRLFWKSAEGRWLKTAYHWTADETMATRFEGGDVDVAGDTYYIPSPKECDQCHKGRDDRALGFEQVSLGLRGAEGLTLSELARQGLLSDPPPQTELAIGDDGTGNAAAALGWLHVNCGVSCHSPNSNSEAYKTDMFLRLSADAVDGRSSADSDSILTTVGIAARTPRWLGRQRVVPGAPDDSLLYTLASHRDPAKAKDQMPPIASRIVDHDGIALVATWIRSLPAP